MSVGGNSEIFITVRVEPSEYFRREGYDVHTDANISLSQALLGGIIRIQVIFGDIMQVLISFNLNLSNNWFRCIINSLMP